ncbi:MAG: PPC domain-containing DNA-binding protein [Ginsengibacter sp.]
MPDNDDTSYAFRLMPGADLRVSIENFVRQHKIQAGWIAGCVGSLTEYSIRFAHQPVESTGNGHFEIVSLAGTVSVNGVHLHISISDSTGKTIGGHLVEGCKIYTTAEIVLLESGKYIFMRQKDGSTSWEELQITEKQDRPGLFPV